MPRGRSNVKVHKKIQQFANKIQGHPESKKIRIGAIPEKSKENINSNSGEQKEGRKEVNDILA